MRRRRWPGGETPRPSADRPVPPRSSPRAPARRCRAGSASASPRSAPGRGPLPLADVEGGERRQRLERRGSSASAFSYTARAPVAVALAQREQAGLRVGGPALGNAANSSRVTTRRAVEVARARARLRARISRASRLRGAPGAPGRPAARRPRTRRAAAGSAANCTCTAAARGFRRSTSSNDAAAPSVSRFAHCADPRRKWASVFPGSAFTACCASASASAGLPLGQQEPPPNDARFRIGWMLRDDLVYRHGGRRPSCLRA